MKTFALMLVIGTAYASLANVVHQLATHHQLNADAKFAYFIIGIGLAIVTAHKLDWID